MIKKLNKDNSGFTIIEVLIVLAIAGLIMLIVFLAVPALQRNQRNNARNSEASRISSSVTECLANKNGQTDSCDTVDELGIGTTAGGGGGAPATVTLTGYQQFESVAFSATATQADTTASPAPGAHNGLTEVVVRYGATCNTDGTTATTTGATARDFVVLYAREPLGSSTTRCLGSQSN